MPSNAPADVESYLRLRELAMRQASQEQARTTLEAHREQDRARSNTEGGDEGGGGREGARISALEINQRMPPLARQNARSARHDTAAARDRERERRRRGGMISTDLGVVNGMRAGRSVTEIPRANRAAAGRTAVEIPTGRRMESHRNIHGPMEPLSNYDIVGLCMEEDGSML